MRPLSALTARESDLLHVLGNLKAGCARIGPGRRLMLLRKGLIDSVDRGTLTDKGEAVLRDLRQRQFDVACAWAPALQRVPTPGLAGHAGKNPQAAASR